MPLNVEKFWAIQELLKRYRCNSKVSVSKADFELALAVMISEKTLWYQKKAARILLDYVLGKSESDKLVESFAVITDRNDRLVGQWRSKVIARDKKCIKCGEEKSLHAHHISHWADDPINRINVNNGVTLCSVCHAQEHPELKSLILSRGVVL